MNLKSQNPKLPRLPSVLLKVLQKRCQICAQKSNRAQLRRSRSWGFAGRGSASAHVLHVANQRTILTPLLPRVSRFSVWPGFQTLPSPASPSSDSDVHLAVTNLFLFSVELVVRSTRMNQVLKCTLFWITFIHSAYITRQPPFLEECDD